MLGITTVIFVSITHCFNVSQQALQKPSIFKQPPFYYLQNPTVWQKFWMDLLLFLFEDSHEATFVAGWARMSKIASLTCLVA